MHLGCAQVQKAPTVPPVWEFSLPISCLHDGKSVLAVAAPENPGKGRITGKPGAHIPVFR